MRGWHPKHKLSIGAAFRAALGFKSSSVHASRNRVIFEVIMVFLATTLGCAIVRIAWSLPIIPATLSESVTPVMRALAVLIAVYLPLMMASLLVADRSGVNGTLRNKSQSEQ